MTTATRLEKAMAAASLALAIAFGIIFSATTAFAGPCDGTNAGAGNCKQAAPAPAPTAPDRWLVIESVIRGLRVVVRL